MLVYLHKYVFLLQRSQFIIDYRQSSVFNKSNKFDCHKTPLSFELRVGALDLGVPENGRGPQEWEEEYFW